ncbi:MAG: hypothetical protein ACHQAX_00140 [Gammaproteobacteria bacterium]
MKKYLFAFMLTLSLLFSATLGQASVLDDNDSGSPYSLNSGSSRSYDSGNQSSYGQISQETGRPRTVHVDPYYRQDGTYVQEHYRSAPSR